MTRIEFLSGQVSVKHDYDDILQSIEKVNDSPNAEFIQVSQIYGEKSKRVLINVKHIIAVYEIRSESHYPGKPSPPPARKIKEK